MDSMGIGLIINFNKKIKSVKGQFAIINPSDFAYDIFKASGTEDYLDIHRDIKNVDEIFD